MFIFIFVQFLSSQLCCVEKTHLQTPAGTGEAASWGPAGFQTVSSSPLCPRSKVEVVLEQPGPGGRGLPSLPPPPCLLFSPFPCPSLIFFPDSLSLNSPPFHLPFPLLPSTSLPSPSLPPLPPPPPSTLPPSSLLNFLRKSGRFSTFLAAAWESDFSSSLN